MLIINRFFYFALIGINLHFNNYKYTSRYVLVTFPSSLGGHLVIFVVVFFNLEEIPSIPKHSNVRSTPSNAASLVELANVLHVQPSKSLLTI